MEFITAFNELPTSYIITQLLLGLVLGFFTGMTGIGAGVLVIPALLFVAGIDPASAIGTSLIFGLLSKGYGVIQHWRMGMVAGQATTYFSVGAIPMVLISSFAVNAFKENYPGDTFDIVMKGIITLMIFLVCIYLFWDSFKKEQKIVTRCDTLLENNEKRDAVLYGTGIGTVVGSTSIGGGIFVIPLLNGVFKLSPQCVVGSSIMISVWVTLAGSGIYLFYGNMNIPVAILLVVGSLPGVNVGCKASQMLPQVYLKRAITGIAIFSLVAMTIGMIG